VIAAGSADDLMRNADSVTGRFSKIRSCTRCIRRAGDARHASIEIAGASLHNLKSIDLRVPLAS